MANTSTNSGSMKALAAGVASAAADAKPRLLGSPARTKLTIASVDEPWRQIAAQYNPKELQLTQAVGWDEATNTSHDPFFLSFKGMKPITTQIELFFDGFETQVSVQPTIDKLKELAEVRDPTSTKDELSRPHICQVTWGTGGIPPLYCVIDSIVTKYLMFDDDGTALRATCTISVKECRRVGRTMVRADGRAVTLPEGRRAR